jgi:hypothetical protein
MNKTLISDIQPYVGMGATIQYWSDRHAATIIQITHDGKRLVLQEDNCIRTDNHGVSEMQEYRYERNPQGTIHLATLRKDGRYRITKTQILVALDVRNRYYDFSF